MPTLAIAEVSDKIPSTADIWSVAGLSAIVVLLSARFKPVLLAIALPMWGLWFAALLMEIHAPDIGPAIVREQGWTYIVQAWTAGSLAVVAWLCGRWWRRRR